MSGRPGPSRPPSGERRSNWDPTKVNARDVWVDLALVGLVAGAGRSRFGVNPSNWKSDMDTSNE